jgi:hypothetical protein
MGAFLNFFPVILKPQHSSWVFGLQAPAANDPWLLAASRATTTLREGGLEGGWRSGLTPRMEGGQ